MRLFFLLLATLCLIAPARAGQALAGRQGDHFFTASDGTRLHYWQAGPPGAPTVVFIPGWTMPGWIFNLQAAAFSGAYQVVEFDPRGQGYSEIAPGGYNQDRRGDDIADLLTQLGPRPVVLVGWSLGVLDTLAYIHTHGDARVAGLVLIDNSVGENPAPLPQRLPPRRRPPVSHATYMAAFVRGMFHKPVPPGYLNALTAAALRTPEADAALLLNYPVPRSYWREAIFATGKPVLYVVRPGLAGQADNLLRDRANTDIAIYTDAGHALFVDDAAPFDALLERFLVRTVWPQ
jgi:microsomal epoxide hydrolase